MDLIELQRTSRLPNVTGRLTVGLLVIILTSVLAIADGPIASSSFVGAEDPLSENGAWAPMMSFAPNGTQFQKNNGAYPDRLIAGNHAGARTTAVLSADHYSEIVVGHVANIIQQPDNVGPCVRVQASGPSMDSHYLWWASGTNGDNHLYRMDANGTTFTYTAIVPSSPVVDGDRLRLIARGPVIYGIKNGVRDFIYNTGPDTTKYSGGTAGMLAFANPWGPPGTNTNGAVTDAVIASWSGGAAPVSSGTWASSNFSGIENPLDEGDRWYPLPGYSGFKKAGQAIGLSPNHNASGVWSITPPANQYSEVTFGAVASGGGGPIVRIDRTNAGQTGWLLFLSADAPSNSGIFKLTPDGGFTAARHFTPAIIPGDKWRLTANGNTLEVFLNGVSQFVYTTDGSYPTGDVGIEAYTSNFTFVAWEGGDTAGGTAQAPTITGFSPTSGPVGTNVAISGTNFTGATAVSFNGVSASFIVNSATAIQATVPAGATTGLLSVTTPGGTATSAANFTVVNPPTITGFSPTSGPAGTSVTINGTNFAGATAVSVNGVSASFTVTSATAIQATVPTGATTGPLSVTVPGGTATSATNFTVVNRPTITGFSPTSGPVGTTVAISGTNFTGATAVSFNGVSAAFTVTSDTAIQAIAPTEATTGPLSVIAPGGTATSATNFTVVNPPTITGFSPTSGPVGTSVTISGSNLTGAKAVTFNGVSASFTVTSDTAIQATAPAAATTGPLSVTTPGGTATSTSNFRVTAILTVTNAGNGSGTVTSSSSPVSPTQINCGPTCSVTYDSGTVVTLTATPATGSTYTAWSGCDSVSGATCTVTMNAARSVNPTFTLQRFPLTVHKQSVLGLGNVGNGTVNSRSSPYSPSQINCGNTCMTSYDYGTVVTLTVNPTITSIFTGWDGCDAVSGRTCTVTISAARSVTANFLP